VEALPTPPAGRDIIASISLGERKGNWLVMMLFVWLLSTYQSKTPMLHRGVSLGSEEDY